MHKASGKGRLLWSARPLRNTLCILPLNLVPHGLTLPLNLVPHGLTLTTVPSEVSCGDTQFRYIYVRRITNGACSSRRWSESDGKLRSARSRVQYICTVCSAEAFFLSLDSKK